MRNSSFNKSPAKKQNPKEILLYGVLGLVLVCILVVGLLLDGYVKWGLLWCLVLLICTPVFYGLFDNPLNSPAFSDYKIEFTASGIRRMDRLGWFELSWGEIENAVFYHQLDGRLHRVVFHLKNGETHGIVVPQKMLSAESEIKKHLSQDQWTDRGFAAGKPAGSMILLQIAVILFLAAGFFYLEYKIEVHKWVPIYLPLALMALYQFNDLAIYNRYVKKHQKWVLVGVALAFLPTLVAVMNHFALRS